MPRVDVERRLAIQRNHTATHLLHAALHKILGEHALQKGSVVDPDRLRFDFSHFQAVTPEELRAIEDEVNSMILADVEASTVEASVDEARKMGAMALFGEKYGDVVRVVKMGDVSTELCGGTHLKHTSQVGLFKITGESSIGSGLRRIEAVTGKGVLDYWRSTEQPIRETARVFSVPSYTHINIREVAAGTAAASGTAMRMYELTKRELEQLKSRGAADDAEKWADSPPITNGVKFVVKRVDDTDMATLQLLADKTADKFSARKEPFVVVFGGVKNGRVQFVCKVTPDLLPRGFHAGRIVNEVAGVAGGGGGGKPEFAQAGGKDPSKVDEALVKARELIADQAGG